MNFHPSSSWMRRKPSALCLSWWTKHVQLETGYVSETEMNVLTRELLLLSCGKEMRERGLLNSNLEQKSNENPRAKFERVWERVSEWELSVRAQNSLLGLYLKGEWPSTVGRGFGARQTLLPKVVQIYFSNNFQARKYFWIFVKNRKGARKVSSMQGCFENSNMQWKN